MLQASRLLDAEREMDVAASVCWGVVGVRADDERNVRTWMRRDRSQTFTMPSARPETRYSLLLLNWRPPEIGTVFDWYALKVCSLLPVLSAFDRISYPSSPPEATITLLWLQATAFILPPA